MTVQNITVGSDTFRVRDEGSGPVLLLVHGFPLDHQMWDRQFAELSGSYRLIAPDLRGFGKSSAATETMRMQDYAEDLARLLDAMSIEQQVVLCGLSMGGYVAFQFVLRHRDRLKGLILCDTRAIADTAEGAANRLKAAEKVLQAGPAELVEGMIPKLFAPATIANQPQIVQKTREIMLATPPQAIAAALRGMAERPDVTGELAGIALPTLVIGGSEEAIVPIAEIAAMAAAIPNARFVEVPDVGHMAPLEAPGPVNAAIREFLGN